MRSSRTLLHSLLVSLVFAIAALGQTNVLPSELEGVGVDEKLGQRLNLDLQFNGENGYPVTLRELMRDGKPVILNMVYYRCPMLCSLVLNAQTSVLKEVAWTAGKEFNIITVSIDPEEMFNLAAAKKKWHLEQYGRAEATQGWRFLTDYQGNSKRLADQIGFKYRWDAKTEQWAHAAVIMVLTPDGRVSRYLYGLKYKPRDVRLALTEASEGKLGTVGDKLLLFCFHYDPSAGSYVPFARNIMKLGGVLTIFVVGSVLAILWRRERRRSDSLPNGVATAR